MNNHQEHVAQVVETVTRNATYVAGGGTFFGASLDWLNANAGAAGVAFTALAYITNLHYQKKLFRLRAAQVEAEKNDKE